MKPHGLALLPLIIVGLLEGTPARSQPMPDNFAPQKSRAVDESAAKAKAQAIEEAAKAKRSASVERRRRKEAEGQVADLEAQIEEERRMTKLVEDAKVSADGTEQYVLTPLSVFRDTLKNGTKSPEMVVVPAGTFQMGANSGDPNEKPVHLVQIVKAFAIARTEVTVDEFRTFVVARSYTSDAESGTGSIKGCIALADGTFDQRMGYFWDKPGFEQEGGTHPVVCVSLNDASAYVNWISEMTGKNYRLPSEAEWEYAARAGSRTERYWGESADDACGFANVADQTKTQQYRFGDNEHDCTDGFFYTAPVASFRPNGYGLYDMLGNVSEWTADAYHADFRGAPTDGSAWVTGSSSQVVRGGSWFGDVTEVRSAKRAAIDAAIRSVTIGFRLARDL